MDTPKQDPIQEKLDSLEKLRFTSTRSKKRKDNPIEVKYEASDPGSNLKKEEEEKDEAPPKFDKNNKKNFQYIYDKIREMRKDMTAAVDAFGCHMNSDEKASKDTQDFQLLCSLLISVQNRDESTAAAMLRLKNFGLDVDNIYKTSEQKILEILGGVNFNKTKAKNIKKAAELITEKYDKKVPASWEELVKFPGIGNKIAVIFLNTAHNLNVGIGVDTHVHRISNCLGWAKTKTPDDTRIELESFVPKEEWSHINHWMVGFGQQICLPINPRCQDCLLNDICPEGKRNMRYVKNKVKVEETEVKVTKKVRKSKDSIDIKEEVIQISVKEEVVEKVKPSLKTSKTDENLEDPVESPKDIGKNNRKKVQKRQNTLC